MAKVKEKDSYDIYLMDSADLDNFYSENKPKASGEFCPRRDPAHEGRCFVCEYIQSEIYDKKYPDDHPARKWASDRKAKQNMFFNVVFKNNPSKLIILEIGSKAGNVIWEGARNKGWTDITHPVAGKGREMTISKFKGQGKWADYNAVPEMNKADWDIPSSVLDNLYDLSKISDMIKDGELSDDNHMRISSLKLGETLKFRICPPWNAKENKRWIGSTFRHWGVSRDQIDGKEPIDWKKSQQDSPKEEGGTGGDLLSDPAPNKAGAAAADLPFTPDPKPTAQKPACHGDARFFSETDPDCREPECFHGVTCKQEIKRKMKE